MRDDILDAARQRTEIQKRVARGKRLIGATDMAVASISANTPRVNGELTVRTTYTSHISSVYVHY